jgi:hypothetical protein
MVSSSRFKMSKKNQITSDVTDVTQSSNNYMIEDKTGLKNIF